MNNYPDLVAQAKGEVNWDDEVNDDFNEDDDWDDEDWLSDDEEEEDSLTAWTDDLLDNAQCDEYACREEFENKCDEA